MDFFHTHKDSVLSSNGVIRLYTIPSFSYSQYTSSFGYYIFSSKLGTRLPLSKFLSYDKFKSLYCVLKYTQDSVGRGVVSASRTSSAYKVHK